MRRGGWRYRPFSFKEVIGRADAKGPAFFQLISYDKNLKHIKTGNYNVKYGNKLRSTAK
jgi:hypothetical protein